MTIKLDPWQVDVLNCDADLVLRSGRQCGKTEVISRKAAHFALGRSNVCVLVIAPTERQSSILFERTLQLLTDGYPSRIKKGRDRPTRHRIILTNGSRILCLPTGLSGTGIRGFTVDLLIADEAAFIPEDVWTAVTPMLSTTKGKLILLGTPHGKKGFFYDCFQQDSFAKFHISAEDCPRIDKEFLTREKRRMTAVQYAQEYLGEFVDELTQYFPTDLIRSCMVHGNELRKLLPERCSRFLGIDVGGMGGDESVLFDLASNGDMLIESGCTVHQYQRTTALIAEVLHLDLLHHYKRIYIDDGGMGVGVFDFLLQHPQTRRKSVSVNNAARSIDRKGHHKRLLKEDLYANLKVLMEQGLLKLAMRDETLLSLSSVQYERDDNGKVRIFGSYTHIAEALIRAAWCNRDKALNIWVTS